MVTANDFYALYAYVCNSLLRYHYRAFLVWSMSNRALSERRKELVFSRIHYVIGVGVHV